MPKTTKPRPRVIDLFCGAGGASVGYVRAGYEVIGVDLRPQPNYPFELVVADWHDFLRSPARPEADLIHASPPCQRYSRVTRVTGDPQAHADLIGTVRATLRQIGVAYVIENVPEAPLIEPLMLCGTMFGLPLLRHRLFETWPGQLVFPPATCCHWGRSPKKGVYGARANGVDFISVTGGNYRKAEAEEAMGIDWMTRRELNEAIPPAYTMFIGEQLRNAVMQPHVC